MEIKSLKSRLLGSAGANLYAQIVTVAIQLIQVPVLLAFWGTQLYGEWLVIYSVPGYLALTDLGVGAVAANRLSMLSSSGNHEQAKVVLRTTWVFLAWVTFGATMLIILGAYLLNWNQVLSLHDIKRGEAGLALALLCAMVVVSLPNSLLGGLYRAGHRNARGVVIASTFRLAQLLVIAGTASFTRSIWITCLALLVLQIVSLMFQMMDVRRFVPNLGLLGSRVNWPDLLGMWRPSLSFMLFPLANGLYFQAGTLVVNACFGASAVVLFNTSRTLTRALSQGISIIKHSLWPEFSHLFGAGDMQRLRKLLYLGMESSLVISIAGSSVLLLLAKPILLWWTHGKVPCDYPLLFLLTGSTIVNGIWFTASALLQATNHHTGYSVVYCLACLVSVGLSMALSPIWGILAVPYSMLIVEVVTGVFVIRRSLQQLNLSALAAMTHIFTLKELRNYCSQCWGSPAVIP